MAFELFFQLARRVVALLFEEMVAGSHRLGHG